MGFEYGAQSGEIKENPNPVLVGKKHTSEQGNMPLESKLDSVFRLFSQKGARFSSRNREHSPDEVDKITLATHGQRIEHLIGGNNTQGILQTIARDGISGYRLASKEENRFRGVPVVAYSLFGGGGPTEKGEEKISFCNNGLASYGEVNWVIPASCAVKKGGILSRFDDPTKSAYDHSLAGLHGKGGEFGYFTPLGACIAAINDSRDALFELAEIKKLPVTDGNPMTVAMKIATDWSSSAIGREMYDEYMKRASGKETSALSQQDIIAHIDAQITKQEGLLKSAQELARDNSHIWGVDLNNPLAICFVPKYEEEKIRAVIEQLGNLADREREFLKNQLIVYETSEEGEGIGPLNEKIRYLSENIHQYAELVLPNMRLIRGNPDLTVDDVVKILQEAEVRIGEDRFGILEGITEGVLYAVKEEI